MAADGRWQMADGRWQMAATAGLINEISPHEASRAFIYLPRMSYRPSSPG